MRARPHPAPRPDPAARLVPAGHRPTRHNEPRAPTRRPGPELTHPPPIASTWREPVHPRAGSGRVGRTRCPDALRHVTTPMAMYRITCRTRARSASAKSARFKAEGGAMYRITVRYPVEVVVGMWRSRRYSSVLNDTLTDDYWRWYPARFTPSFVLRPVPGRGGCSAAGSGCG